MKKVAKAIIVAILGWQVRRLRRKNPFRVIAVAGSIGKTSTKFAIRSVLDQHFRVRSQAGNYNDLVTVPLIFFGQPEPSVLNALAWLKVLISNEQQLHKPYPYDVVLVELGPDGPGQMTKFKQYLTVDLGVLTAIAPEHMEFFTDLNAVAAEELVLADLSKSMLVNADLADKKYLSDLKTPIITYGRQSPVDYGIADVAFSATDCQFSITHQHKYYLSTHHDCVAEAQLYSICAATAVGRELGMTAADIIKGIATIQPVNGRMKRLKGLKNSTILDDTYNASPVATKAALETFYRLDAPQKIALLGNMNELGKFSADAHREIGQLCDPKQIDQLITLGPDANQYLAETAEKRGCKVQRFTSPYEAGTYIKTIIKPHALILAKGSQNRVFAEEAVKQLLANPSDTAHLVRQSPQWLKIKHQAFKDDGSLEG